jgi:hypothetical protein
VLGSGGSVVGGIVVVEVVVGDEVVGGIVVGGVVTGSAVEGAVVVTTAPVTAGTAEVSSPGDGRAEVADVAVASGTGSDDVPADEPAGVATRPGSRDPPVEQPTIATAQMIDSVVDRIALTLERSDPRDALVVDDDLDRHAARPSSADFIPW